MLVLGGGEIPQYEVGELVLTDLEEGQLGETDGKPGQPSSGEDNYYSWIKFY